MNVNIPFLLQKNKTEYNSLPLINKAITTKGQPYYQAITTKGQPYYQAITTKGQAYYQAITTKGQPYYQAIFQML